MLGKLIKHDFRALSRTLIPANIAILGATILATIAVAFNIRNGYSNVSEGPFMQIIQSVSVLLVVLMVIAIIAAFVFIMLVIYHRFYKNFMTSEGYLTFTLPAKTSSLLWSKLITAIIWTVFSTLVGILCLFIFLTFGTSSSGVVNTNMLSEIGKAFSSIGMVYTSGITVIIIEVVLFLFVATISGILQVYLALIIGGAVSQKHKLAAGIGFYFVINTATGIITSIVSVTFSRVLSNRITSISINPDTIQEAINAIVSVMQPIYWVTMALTILYSVAFFILSHYFLKNKLNLE